MRKILEPHIITLHVIHTKTPATLTHLLDIRHVGGVSVVGTVFILHLHSYYRTPMLVLEKRDEHSEAKFTDHVIQTHHTYYQLLAIYPLKTSLQRIGV